MTRSNNPPKHRHDPLRGGVTPALRRTPSWFEMLPRVREGSQQPSLASYSERRYRTLKGAMT